MAAVISVEVWMKTAVILLIAHYLSAQFAVAAAAGESISQERFKAEARKAWTTYREHALTLNGSSVRKTFNGGKLQFHSELEFLQNKRCRALVAKRFIARTRRQEVYCRNPDYFFTLQSGLDKTDWAMTSLVLDKREASKQAEQALTRAGFVSYGIDDLIRLGAQIDLIGLLDYKHFILDRVEAESLDNNIYAKVTFRCFHPVDEMPFVPVQSGVLLLDPKCFWCLKRAELKVAYTGSEGTENIDYKYRTSGPGIPIPEQIIKTDVGTADGKPSAYSIVFDYAVALKERPDSEFYLSAFGLPEPVGITAPRQSTPMHWWLAGAAAVITATGVWCRRRRKGHAASPAKS